VENNTKKSTVKTKNISVKILIILLKIDNNENNE